MRKETPSVAVSFIANSSNSGKTTLIEKIVRILKARGLRVAVIKHASRGFDLDRPGKDSWRFQEAGADIVMLVGPGRTATMRSVTAEPSQPELDAMPNADIVIQEGFKQTAANRIEVFRSGVSGDKPLCMSDPSIIALVSDKRFDVSIPFFDLNDADRVAEFLIKNFMRR